MTEDSVMAETADHDIDREGSAERGTEVMESMTELMLQRILLIDWI